VTGFSALEAYDAVSACMLATRLLAASAVFRVVIIHLAVGAIFVLLSIFLSAVLSAFGIHGRARCRSGVRVADGVV